MQKLRGASRSQAFLVVGVGLSLLCWRQVYGADRAAAVKALLTAGNGRDAWPRLLVIKWHTKQADDLATHWRANAASAGIREGIR